MTTRFQTFRFSLRQLQYVVAVAELQHFRKAAERCHVAQPSLSAQVAEVEEQLGVVIFERDPRGVRVTEAGQLIVEQARHVLRESEELEATARRTLDPLRSTLRVGIIPTIAPYLLPRLVAPLRARAPGLKILWREEKTADLVAKIVDGELDGAVLGTVETDSGLESTTVASDVFVVAIAKEHALSNAHTPVDLESLSSERLLLLEEGHCLRTQVQAACASADASTLAFRATSLPTLVQMVATNLGVTLLPEMAVPFETARATIAVRPLEGAPSRPISIARRKRTTLEPAFVVLGEAIAKALSQAPHERVTAPPIPMPLVTKKKGG